MNYSFDTKEKYIGFLEKLSSYCNTVAILKEDDEDVPSEFIDRIEPYMAEVKWMSRFPGYGKFGGDERVQFFPLCKEVLSTFKEHDSFLTVGYDLETELGLDMAFYKGKDLVFNVIRHEDMCYLEEKHEPYFKKTIEQYEIGLMQFF